MGAVMGLAGIEHGIGEILQGNVAPAGIMIQSWPNSAFFRSLSGEPALTVIPNLLAAGILTVIVSLVFLAWSLGFVQRKNGGLMMIFLSILMLLVGGGLFPPVLGLVVGIVTARANKTLEKKTARISNAQRFFGKIFSGIYAVNLIAWPALLFAPGALNYFLGIDSTAITLSLMVIAFGSLALGFIAGFARYRLRRDGAGQPA